MQGYEVRREERENRGKWWGRMRDGFDQNALHACMNVSKILFKKKKTNPQTNSRF